MAVAKYDLYIETGPLPEDSRLVTMRFPAMRSQFENPADTIQLSLKPKSLKFKLDVILDHGSVNFSRNQAEVLRSKSDPKVFNESSIVDKNIYTSTRITVDDGQLFVCQVVNNKMICRPVSDLLTMRSDFTHLDIKEEVEMKEDVKPVSIKFASSDRPNASNRFYTNQQESDDLLIDYQPLSFKNVTSREACNQRVALFGKHLPKVKPDPDANEDESFNLISDIKLKVEKVDTDEDHPSELVKQISQKKIASIRQLVRDCLLKAKLVSYEEVRNYIDENSSFQSDFYLNDKDILDSLAEYGMLVQGNWAVKSELLCGNSAEREFTEVTGISINLFSTCRDYLLWLFTQDRQVSRLEFSRQVRIPDLDILELFNQLAVLKKQVRKWELKLPTDNKFLEQFPDVVQRQATFWKVRRANKLHVFA